MIKTDSKTIRCMHLELFLVVIRQTRSLRVAMSVRHKSPLAMSKAQLRSSFLNYTYKINANDKRHVIFIQRGNLRLVLFKQREPG